MSVVFLAVSEEGSKRVVAGNHEASKVGKKLTTKVEDDEEEVEGNNANDGVGLGNTSLLLEVDEGGVLGQLMEELLLGHLTRIERTRRLPHITYLPVDGAEVILSFSLGGRHLERRALAKETMRAIRRLREVVERLYCPAS